MYERRYANRHELRMAATKVLWDKRSMLPQDTDEMVDDVLDAILPLIEIEEVRPLRVGHEEEN